METNKPFMPPPPPPKPNPQVSAEQPQQNVTGVQQNVETDFSYKQALPQEKPKAEKKKKEKSQEAQQPEDQQKSGKKERVFDGKGLVAPLLFLLSAIVAVGLVVVFVLYRGKLF